MWGVVLRDTRLTVPEPNVEVVRGFYDALARGELPRELLDPDVEYVNPATAIEPGIRQGIDAVNAAVQSVLDGWEYWHMKPERLLAAGDQVAVTVSYRARGRSSGVEVDGRESALLTLRAGKIIRYEWFHGPDEAFAAVQPMPPNG